MTSPSISRLLVANRGEIARRIFATCRRMGISTVAVYSDPDRNAPFVQEADVAVTLPGSSSTDTYLSIDRLIEAAQRTDADGIHPGYGFLSENAGFARAVMAAGLTWVGPSPEAIETMGSKLAAKQMVEQAGVPTLPGVDLSGMDEERIASSADDVGYPVLVKASAGGGGKGMRIVGETADLADAVASAQREAEASFGDGTVFLERYLEAPRHIEIQVFADSHGNTVSLFERECSIQRRHQKIIEEAPSVALTEEMRARMSEAAVAAAEAVGYLGAGTVEFLYQDDEFFFLEMNTRLQVEHPVTEMITGLDLVRLQLQAAAGHPLPEEAKTPDRRGHSIEARLYAEDPVAGFMPVTGKLHRVRFPSLKGVRIDSGVEDGSDITPHYDPMLAKVVAWAPTREEAARLLGQALEKARLHGSTTNRRLLVRVLRHEAFLAGKTDTHFLERHDLAALGAPLASPDQEERAALAAALADQARRRAEAPVLASIPSGWRNVASQKQTVSYDGEHGPIEVAYRFDRQGELEVVGHERVRLVESGPHRVVLETDGLLEVFEVARYGDVIHVDGSGGPVRLVERARFPDSESDEQPGSLHSPMPGTVLRVDVVEGDQVKEGQVLLVMEAMKMEHSLRAPHTGKVTALHAAQGEQVTSGAVLVVVEET